MGEEQRGAGGMEYVQIIGQGLVAWLEGEVLAEYVRFLEEEAAPLHGGVKWLEGDVLADFLQFLGEENECAVHGSSNDSYFMEEDDGGDDDEELAQLLPHIMSLPAVVARAAAPAASAMQESEQLVGCQEGWL